LSYFGERSEPKTTAFGEAKRSEAETKSGEATPLANAIYHQPRNQ